MRGRLGPGYEISSGLTADLRLVEGCLMSTLLVIKLVFVGGGCSCLHG